MNSINQKTQVGIELVAFYFEQLESIAYLEALNVNCGIKIGSFS